MKRILVFLIAAAALAQPYFKTRLGQWWKDQHMIKMLELNADQQKKLDDVFQQYRVRLIDHTAAVEREEAIMDQLMNAQPPEPAKIRAGIDRVADARGQLEKTKANMLLDMRLILTAEQWKALQERPAFGAKEYFKTPSPDAAPVPKPKR